MAVPEANVYHPAWVQGRGRPTGPTSTRHEPLHFEHIENAQGSHRRCRNCNQVGHNTRTCQAAPISEILLMAPAVQATLTAKVTPNNNLANFEEDLGPTQDWEGNGAIY